MTILSVSDAACIAGVETATINSQIDNGVLNCSPDGIDVAELICVYPELKPLAGLKIRAVKKPTQDAGTPSYCNSAEIDSRKVIADAATLDAGKPVFTQSQAPDNASADSETVSLLIRELEWNKELLEQTNRLMAKQLSDQRALIADQARRLDEKDRFWARQVEIAQSLLAAPQPRKKYLGIF